MKRCGLSAGILVSALVLSGCAGGQAGASVPETSVSEESASETTTVSETSASSEETVVETTTEDAVKIPDEYYEVIDSIVSCVDNFDPGGINTYFGNEYGGGVCELCSYDDPKSLVGFAFADIDGDKTAELVVLEIGPNYENRIIELYTYTDGEVKHLLSGGFRSRIYLSSDMILYLEGSSGAFYSSVARYELDENNHEAVFMDAYYTLPVDIGGENEGIRICYTTDKGSILSEDVDSDNVEEIEVVTGSFDIYEQYGVKSVGLFVYDEVTSLADYSG